MSTFPRVQDKNGTHVPIMRSLISDQARLRTDSDLAHLVPFNSDVFVQPLIQR